MQHRYCALYGASLLALASSPALAQETRPSDPLTDVIVVTGQVSEDTSFTTSPADGEASAPDAAALVARLPGAAIIGNGPISGQVQYRGLFSDRLLLRVNGQKFQTGGPNAMDPPLHYAPMILVDRIEVSRGTGPVREGPGLGGSVNARLKQVDFGAASTFAPAISAAASYRTADHGLAAGGVAGAASERFRFNVIGSWEEGDDYRIGKGGRAASTGYERLTYGVSGGFQSGGNSLSLDLRRQETGRSGNPPYAMDIDFFHSNFARIAFDGDIGIARLKAELGYAAVKHGMENFSFRPAPADRSKWRYSYADADTLTAALSLQRGIFTAGVDGEQVDRLVTITNPNVPGFAITSLNRVDQHRLGLFGEVATNLGGYRLEAGARVDMARSRMADPTTGAAVPPMLAMLARQVGAANRPLEDTTWDAVIRLWGEEGAIRPRLTLAHKSRIPNAVERHGWVPTEASGGLADGNIYIGNAALKPEEAWTAEGGVDIETGTLRLRPSIYYRRIDNYIQGVPVPASMTAQRMIAAMNGDATPLMFANVDAELYGADMDLNWVILPGLEFSATASYVRGKRRDIGDNLYRIAPLNGRASLTWGIDGWWVSAEAVGAAKQDKVSATNSERASPGWVIANLWGGYRLADRLSLSAGVENIFDRRYADHLAGINRVPGGAVAVGEHMPGVGRSLFVRIGIDY